MKALKSARTLAASLGVLAFGALAASPAMAFDDVDWDWHKDVNEKVDIDVDIDINLESTGLVEVEKLQIFLGNVSAESKVHDITNIQYDRDNYIDSPAFKDGEWGSYPVAGAYCYCYPRIDIDAAPFDATVDLPSVISAATAVGNNQSITSDVPVFLHDGQFVANTWFNWGGDDVRAALVSAMPAGFNGGPGGYQGGGEGNLHTDLAILFTLGSALGFLQPADISASSNVWNIKNATVDSSATAVANNLSVTLESNLNGGGSGNGEEPVDQDAIRIGNCQPWQNCPSPNPQPTVDPTLSNHVVIADITQFAYANVSAVSNVYDVTLNDYSNLSPDVDTSVLGRPIVNSTATAVGNNVSITVGVPDASGL